MKSAILGFAAAVVIHAVILLFGGILFFSSKEAEARGPVREVALFSEEQAAEDAKKNEQQEEKKDLETRPADELEQDEERPPDIQQVFEAEEQPQGSPTDSVARLDAMSLSALESALAGGAAGGDAGFAVAGSLASGGRIGGTGMPGSTGSGGSDGGDLSGAFDVSELDQRARPIFQAAPIYPADLRQKKTQGIVTVVFVVDTQGKVLNPRVEKSDNEGFDRPALEAVRQWRFDPAVRGGEKVASKVRVPIRFALDN